MNHECDEEGCGCNKEHALDRRDFLRLSSLALTAAGALSVGGLSLLPKAFASDSKSEPVLKIGYLPITDATPLLIAHAKGFFDEENVRTEKPVLMRGWTELAEGFLAGSFNLVHLLMPIPIYMRYQQKYPVKIVAWNHTNGSALTVGMKSGIGSLEEVGGKHIAVPHWYSMHNVLMQLCLRQFGIEAVVQDRKIPLRHNQTNLFVMKPPDMPTAMAQGAIDGYIVAEPFNAAGEILGGGEIVRFSGDIFKDHPCCVVTMKEPDIEAHPGWAQRVLNALVKAQYWTANNREEAAGILSRNGKRYLPMEEAVIKRALTKYDLKTYGVETGTGAIRHPEWQVNRIDFQPYPYESATQEIVKLLKQTKLEGNSAFLQKLDPDQVVTDLFNYTLVKKAADKIGGLGVFPNVKGKDPYIREEIIRV